MIVEQDGQPLIFVVDIQVYEGFRRRGYGTAAFCIMEDHAREIGITTIALNVFDHNHRARAMYEKLGYQGSGESMVKTIEGAE
jgi:RimJ/RimL family protein N-acetyltransferase